MQEHHNEYFNKGSTTRRNFLTVENPYEEQNQLDPNSPIINSNNLLDLRNINFFDRPSISEGNLRSQKPNSYHNEVGTNTIGLQSERIREQQEEEEQDQSSTDKYEQINNKSSIERRNGVRVEAQKKKSLFNDLIFKLRMKNKARKLANSINSRMYKNLTYPQYIMIGDKASDRQYLTKHYQNEVKQVQSSASSSSAGENNENIELKRSIIFQFLSKIDSFLPVFDPRSKMKVYLEVLNLMSIVLIFYSFCIIISFKLNIATIISPTILQIAIGVIFMNSFVNLNTGFYEDMKLQRDHQQMFLQYYKTHFIVDIISFFSIIILFLFDRVHFLLDQNVEDADQSDIEVTDLGTLARFIVFIPFFFKLRDFSKFMIQLEEKVNFQKYEQNVIQLVKLFSSVILIDHFMACIWIFIAKLSANLNSSWQTKKDYQMETWFRQYTLSFYYSTVTMTTVGYGDITPTNQTEHLVCIFMMLISSGVFGFTLNQIGIIFSELYADTKENRLKMNTINRYMEKKNLNYPLRSQIRQYLEYVWRENNEQLQNDSAAIIDQLNDSLKMELQYNQNEKIITYFKKHYSNAFMQKAMTLIKEVQCKPQQLLYKAGQIDDISLYLVEKGKVEVFYKTKPIPRISPSSQFLIHEISEGQLFGIRQFYTGLPRDLNVRAVGFVTLLRVSREDFMHLLEQFPEEKEIFCYIRDNITLYQDGFKSSSSCPSCGSFKHHLLDCNTVHYVPHQQNVCLRHSYIPQENWEQKERRKFQLKRLTNNNNNNNKKNTGDDKNLEESGQSDDIRQRVRQNTRYDLPEYMEQYYFDQIEYIEEYESKYLEYNFDYSYITKQNHLEDELKNNEDQLQPILDDNGQPINNRDDGSLYYLNNQQISNSLDISANLQNDQQSDFIDKQMSFSNQIEQQDSNSEYSPRQRMKILQSPKRGPARRDSNSELKPKQNQPLMFRGPRKQSNQQSLISNSPSVRNVLKQKSIIFQDQLERQHTPSDFSKYSNDLQKENQNVYSNTIAYTNSNGNTLTPQLFPGISSNLTPTPQINGNAASIIQNQANLNFQTQVASNFQPQSNINFQPQNQVNINLQTQVAQNFQNSNVRMASNLFPINEDYLPNLQLARLVSADSANNATQMPQLQHFSSVQQQPMLYHNQLSTAISSIAPQNQNNSRTDLQQTGLLKRAFSIKMKNFQKNILKNIEKIMQKNTNGQQAKKQLSLIDETDAQYGLQQIFRNFDKQKNFYIYFPLNNLTYVLMKNEKKILIKKGLYLDILQQKKKQPLSHQQSSSHTLFRQKYDKLQVQTDRLLNKNSRGNSSQYSQNKQKTQEFQNHVNLDNSNQRKSAFFERNNFESPINSMTDRQLQILSAKSANNVKVSLNNLFSRNDISINEVNHEIRPQEISPNVQDLDSTPDIHQIHSTKFQAQEIYFNSNI